MNLILKNKVILIFYSMTTIFLLFWAIFITWLIKKDVTWNPVQFFIVFVPLIFLAFIPSVYLIKFVNKLRKNIHISFSISKKFLGASLFIAFLTWSLSIFAFTIYFFPAASINSEDNGPYLIWNDDPRTTMAITWLTETPKTTKLDYGPSIEEMVEWNNNILTRKHVAELRNLQPGTFYYYRIADFPNKLYNFTTAPSELTSPFNFIALSDTHAASSSSKFEAILNTMNSWKYDFIVHAGDVAGQEGEDISGWQEFFSIMDRHGINKPLMIAAGNHEYGVDLFGRNFKYYFSYDYVELWGHYYSFDYLNAHFVMLDVFQNQLDWGGFLLESQEAWLKKTLAENQDKWLIVVMHAPLYSTGDYNMNKKLIAQLAPIFYQYHVDVVLSGHDHHYEVFWTNRSEAWGGTYYFVIGGGGGSLDTSIMRREENPWKEKSHEAPILPYQYDYVTLNDQIYGELAHHFLHVEVYQNFLHIRTVRLNGTIIQEFVIRK